MVFRRTRAAALTFAFVLTLVTAELVMAGYTPVSSVVKARALSGSVTHEPPPVVVGPEYGVFTISAHAFNPPIAASAAARLDIFQSSITQRVEGQSGGRDPQTGIAGAGFGSVVSVVDIPEPTTFDIYLAKSGSPDHFGATATIRVADGGPTLFFRSAPLTTSPPQIHLTLDPGRYEVLFSGLAEPRAGTGGGGAGTFRVIVIPEPTRVAIASLATAPLLCRRRRRGINPN